MICCTSLLVLGILLSYPFPHPNILVSNRICHYNFEEHLYNPILLGDSCNSSIVPNLFQEYRCTCLDRQFYQDLSVSYQEVQVCLCRCHSILIYQDLSVSYQEVQVCLCRCHLILICPMKYRWIDLVFLYQLVMDPGCGPILSTIFMISHADSVIPGTKSEWLSFHGTA